MCGGRVNPADFSVQGLRSEGGVSGNVASPTLPHEPRPALDRFLDARTGSTSAMPPDQSSFADQADVYEQRRRPTSYLIEGDGKALALTGPGWSSSGW